jgi:hypothetical protein
MRYFLIALLVLIIGCSRREEPPSDCKNTNTSIFDYELGLTITGPTLTITCQYDDCGEWGGHREEIRLVKNNQSSFCLDYQKDSVNCANITELFDGFGFYYGVKRVPAYGENSMAPDAMKKHIRNFASTMMQSIFEDDFYFSHAGVITTIANRDSSLFIQTYSNKADNFNYLKQQLGLK